MENLKLLAGVLVGTLILIVGVAFMFSGEEVGAEEYDLALVRGDAKRVKVIGSQEATGSGQLAEGMVELVEFSDFECPACAASQVEVTRVLEKFGERVALIYRHFPLETIHKQAKLAAIASEAAADEGKFFEYHDLLFQRQDEWTEAEDVKAILADYAQELGMEREGFVVRLEDTELAARVEKDMADGRSLGINSTPTFFVNGKKVSTNNLESEINAQL